MINEKETWPSTTAAHVLRELKDDPGILILALRALKPRATNNKVLITTLGDLGDAARPALPYLLGALTNADELTRHYATNALLKVAPEALTNSPIGSPER